MILNLNVNNVLILFCVASVIIKKSFLRVLCQQLIRIITSLYKSIRLDYFFDIVNQLGGFIPLFINKSKIKKLFFNIRVYIII